MQSINPYSCHNRNEFASICVSLAKFGDESEHEGLDTKIFSERSSFHIPITGFYKGKNETQKALQFAEKFFKINQEYLKPEEFPLLKKFIKASIDHDLTEEFSLLIKNSFEEIIEDIKQNRNEAFEKAETQRKRILLEAENDRRKRLKQIQGDETFNKSLEKITHEVLTLDRPDYYNTPKIIQKFEKEVETITQEICHNLEEQAFSDQKAILEGTSKAEKKNSALVPNPKAQSFPTFLKKNGYVGIPEGLNQTLGPIFAKFGVSRYAHLKELVLHRGIDLHKGILLSGPPGTGKTFFGRLLVDFLKKEIKIESKSICTAELINSLVGETEERIRELFDIGKDKPDQLTVLLLDEFDTISQKRKDSSKRWEIAEVNQFLSCLDGLNNRDNLLVIVTTNNESLIDKAFLRPGRFDSIIRVKLPNEKERKKLFKVYMKPLYDHKVVQPDVDLNELVKDTEGYSPADVKGLVMRVNHRAFLRAQKLFDKKDASPEIVNQSKETHIYRDDFLEEMKAKIETTEEKVPLKLSPLIELLSAKP